MTTHGENDLGVQPYNSDSWADQPSHTYIEDIDALRIEHPFVGVGQRQIIDFRPEEGPVSVVSDGFSHCSGLIMRNQVQGTYTFSHLEPFGDAFHRQMQTGSRTPIQWEEPRDAVLIYGSVSSRQFEIEKLLQEQFWGPATLRTVSVETSNYHWGIAFNGLRGELAVVRKVPDQSILRYKLFESL
jgi:hypothetical protein